MNNLYSPIDICKKIGGINPRAIADMAQNGLVIPVKDTTGAGTARMYDKECILKIMIIKEMRGHVPIDYQRSVILSLKYVKEPILNIPIGKYSEFIIDMTRIMSVMNANFQ